MPSPRPVAAGEQVEEGSAVQARGDKMKQEECGHLFFRTFPSIAHQCRQGEAQTPDQSLLGLRVGLCSPVLFPQPH